LTRRDAAATLSAGDATVTVERPASVAAIRLLAWVVLAVMAAATMYTAWIALTNFNRIGV
jgi:hypothetical protein